MLVWCGDLSILGYCHYFSGRERLVRMAFLHINASFNTNPPNVMRHFIFLKNDMKKNTSDQFTLARKVSVKGLTAMLTLETN